VAERFSFGKIPEVLPLPDLLAVQHESFQWFLDEGFREIFEEISPIEDFTGSLALVRSRSSKCSSVTSRS
jgi:DNA-directed RNA polymerase subunit beta